MNKWRTAVPIALTTITICLTSCSSQVTGTSTPAASSGSQDEAAIKDLTQQVTAAAASGATAVIMNLTCGAAHDQIASNINKSRIKLTPNKLPPGVTVSVESLVVTGNDATATVSSHGPNPDDNDSAAYTYQKVNGDWKICDTK